MPNKSFSLYSSGTETCVNAEDQLVLEIGKLHIAVILKKGDKQSVCAFELFNFKEEETGDFKKLFNLISADSKLLSSPNTGAKVYINNPLCIPVPIFKFNKDIAEDYLNLIFSEDVMSSTFYEHVPIEPGIMNVFRFNKKCQNVLSFYLSGGTFHHTYSNIIRSLKDVSDRFSAQFISVKFYNTYFIVTVVIEGNLHLIQTFNYQAHEDVLYHLLNITHSFKLNFDRLVVQVSGMIDLESALYKELVKYFKEVAVEIVNTANFSVNINEHPLHYFTPYFNLAT